MNNVKEILETVEKIQEFKDIILKKWIENVSTDGEVEYSEVEDLGFDSYMRGVTDTLETLFKEDPKTNLPDFFNVDEEMDKKIDKYFSECERKNKGIEPTILFKGK